MVKHFAAVLAVVGLGWGPSCAEEAKPAPVKPDAAAVAKLVAQLGSDRYEDREAASQALDALGPLALDALHKALAGSNPETRKRAADLMKRIDKRLETIELTQPKMVRLSYTDLPVAEAVQDIARKTGFQIQFQGDQTKLANRKITLDTGEVPFWQAIDQFCEKAGLVERGSAPGAEPPKVAADQKEVEFRAARAVAFSSTGRIYGGRPEIPLVLLDGKLPALPTYYAGAVRVRVLPQSAPAAPQSDTQGKDAEGKSPVTIEVSPEPKMGVREILSVRVEKILDDQGNELKTPLPHIYGAEDYAAEFDGRVVLANSVYFDNGVQTADLSTRAPFRLDIPNGVKKLKEVRGFVAADVLTGPMPLMTVENILDAAGKTVEGKYGGSLKVAEVKRDDKGQITLKVVVEKPSAAQLTRGVPGRMRPWRRGGAFGEERPNDTNALGRILLLTDEKGQAFKLTASEEKASGDEDRVTFEYQLTYQPPDSEAKPAKLVYLGRRRTTIDVPFVLKDVPVP
jgi:hypothetical protein